LFSLLFDGEGKSDCGEVDWEKKEGKMKLCLMLIKMRLRDLKFIGFQLNFDELVEIGEACLFDRESVCLSVCLSVC
jgi:hypothetical protein